MTGSETGATGDRNLRRMLGLGFAIAALLGVAAAGGTVVRATSTTATAGDALPYALAGAAGGILVAGVIIIAVRSARPGSGRLRPLELLAALFIAAAIGALLGAAFTPDPKTADDVSSLDNEETERRREQREQIDENARAGTVDRDGDGQPDRDSNGDPIIAYDEDGDGRIDGYLQACPPGTPVPEPRPGYTPIDDECDGTVDRWLPFDPSTFLTDGPEFRENAPITVPPEERERRADEANRDRFSGRLLTILLIVLAVAVCAAIVTWLVRMPDRNDEDGDETPEEGDDAPPPPPGVDLSRTFAASLDTMLDDPDPRTAICAAYGRLLDGFATAGLARRPEEGPEEHVARCLATARMDPAPVRELLRLFALARFSSHPVDESHRAAAVAAMRAALASTPTPAGSARS